jgi:non-canonical purine NTP pyrophosphatase (RdgB/HAM1 family)
MKFITGNIEKFKEIKRFIPELEQLKIDLPEIQELDAKKVIEAKLVEARKFIEKGTEIIVEDTSLYIKEMKLLPGPLIKWFLQSLGVDGIWNIVQKFDSREAYAKTIIGYIDKDSNSYYFEGVVEGYIIAPRGVGFGWYPLFQVKGSNKNFVEMNDQEKEKFSMRSKAVIKLKLFLEQKKNLD